MPIGAQNIHATGIVLGTFGLLIAGPSGSGKTTLALRLIEAWGRRGHASFIADDQLFLSAAHGRLIAMAPPTIAGLAEVVGLGPQPVRHIGRAIVDGIIHLVPASPELRFRGQKRETILGCTVRSWSLEQRSIEAALAVLPSWLLQARLA